MDLFRRYGNLLRADGTNQLQRLLPGLEADYIRPDERTLSDMIEYASQLAAQLRFYDLGGQSAGTWAALLESFFDTNTGLVLPPADVAALLATRTDWPAHVVLFLVFLTLFQNLQGDLNELTGRHLAYHYGTALGLQRRAPVPDNVHVLFQLARNAPATLLPAGTLLDGGKDAKGQPLRYATQNELLVSPATVTAMRRLVVEHDRSLRRRFFVAEGFTPLEGTAGYTFGRTQLDLDPSQRFMSEASLGFAIAAPILTLGEGVRTITILVHLSPPASASPIVSQGVVYALDVELTGAAGWLAPDSIQAELQADDGLGMPALSLTLTLGAALPAVVPFDSTLHGPGIATSWPVVRCLVKGESGLYEVLDGLIASKVELTVDVKGVRNLVVQNADSPLSATQPIPLFGATPQIGAPFYVGSAEVFSKKLARLALNLNWKSPPPDLMTYYLDYFDVVDSSLRSEFNDLFSCNVAILYNRAFWPLLGEQSLFSPRPTDVRTLLADSTAFTSGFSGMGYVAQPQLQALDSFSPSTPFGFIRMVLTRPKQADLSSYALTSPFEAFGHAAFPKRYAYQAIALAQTPASTTPKPGLPNPPYTPTLSSLSLDYRAEAQFEPADPHAAESFLVVGPFGAAAASTEVPALVVPQIDGSAALLLGIGSLSVPANLALFFEIDAGTADATPVLQPGATQWSYLDAADSWQLLSPSAVLIDSTQGFQAPGIVSISVPQDAALEHENLPSGLVWLRALINGPPQSAARTLSLQTNAVLARFQPGSLPLTAYEQHLEVGLPAGTITRLLQRNANIKSVAQPDPSFGELGQEGDTQYFQRCSERLRHRNRAVTAWDFERLVLQQFPDVFKVKCLPNTDASGLARAGDLALVIIPNLLQSGSSDPLEPKAGDVLLGDIGDYLADLGSPFANIHVIRAVFERIRVQAQVVFAAGRDPGYYSTVLNDDLKRFLSPWAYEDGEDILFGARIYRSDILAFMEGRDYVDHLIDVKIYHSFAGPSHEGLGWMTIGLDFIIRPDPQPAVSAMTIGTDFVVGRGVEFAEATQPQAILVSHPQHLITAVPAGKEICSGITQLGIGYMTIDLDFTVQAALTV